MTHDALYMIHDTKDKKQELYGAKMYIIRINFEQGWSIGYFGSV